MLGTDVESVSEIFVIKRLANSTDTSSEMDAKIFTRHEFVTTKTGIALPVVILLSLASIVGTLGNVLILTVVFMKRSWQHVEMTFIGNLALADLYVTVVADPMSVLGR